MVGAIPSDDQHDHETRSALVGPLVFAKSPEAFLRVARRNRSAAAEKIVESMLTRWGVNVHPIAEKR
jgi:hypothetical protein